VIIKPPADNKTHGTYLENDDSSSLSLTFFSTFSLELKLVSPLSCLPILF